MAASILKNFSFSSFFGKKEPEKRYSRLITESELPFLFSQQSLSGAIVNPDNALKLSTVWRAVKILGETIASLPFQIVEELPDGTRNVAVSHPSYGLVHTAPSDLYSTYMFMETMVVQSALLGNSYARIIRDRATGRPRELRIIPPEKVEVYLDERERPYYKVDMVDKVFRPDDILHIAGMSWNGMVGLHTIRYVADVLGTALSVQEYGANFYKNGAQLGGVIEHPGKLTMEQLANLKQSFSGQYSGAKNSGKVPILEEGMQYKQYGLTPVDAAFIDTKKVTVADVARIFGVPQFLLEDLDRATFNNIEHLSRMFVSHTIRPWCKRIQAEFDRKLFPDSEMGRFHTRFDLKDLLQADTEAQAEFHAAMFNTGAMSINDIRRDIGLNPIAGGDTHLVPMNMHTIQNAMQSDEEE